MNVDDQIAIFEKLSEEEQHWLGMVCVCLGDTIPPAVAKSLLSKHLIRRIHGKYDVESYWIHYSWCVWCARKEAAGGPDEDQERP